VPTLVLQDGSSLYGGALICEYLDSLGAEGPSLFPRGPAGWVARRQFFTGDGLFDATTNLRVESWRPPGQRNGALLERERRKVVGALDQMERDAGGFAGQALHIGHVGFAGGLSYLDHRNPLRELALLGSDAQFDWRTGRPALSAWYEQVSLHDALRFRLEWNAETRVIQAVTREAPRC
jgi:glutathione S-transferase